VRGCAGRTSQTDRTGLGGHGAGVGERLRVQDVTDRQDGVGRGVGGSALSLLSTFPPEALRRVKVRRCMFFLRPRHHLAGSLAYLESRHCKKSSVAGVPLALKRALACWMDWVM
jgi:hypothetical protein